MKNSSNLDVRRHKCRKSGQYGYLYSASLSSRGITSWVFSMSNKTHESRCSRYSFSRNGLSFPVTPCQGWDFQELLFCPAALNGRARIGHRNGGAQVWSRTKSPIKPCCLPHLCPIPIKRRWSWRPDQTNHKFDTVPLRGAVWTFRLLLAVKIYPSRNHLYASTSGRTS